MKNSTKGDITLPTTSRKKKVSKSDSNAATELNDLLEFLQRMHAIGKPDGEYITLPVSLMRKAIRAMSSSIHNEADYLSSYPDVVDAINDGHFESGLDHFVSVGLYEGRKFGDIPLDAEAYLQSHRDVQKAIEKGEYSSALDHFKNVGFQEGRAFRLNFE